MRRYCIYIVLTRSNSVVSKFIKFVRKYEYTHASIALDKDINSMYSFGRKYARYPFLGRFKEENVNDGMYRLHKVLPGAVVEVEVTKEQYEKAKKIVDIFIYNKKSYKYNYRGLLDNLIGREECRDDRFLCSEFVYYVLMESGILTLDIPRNLVTPQDLLNINGKIIYKGDLKTMSYKDINEDKIIEDLGLTI